MEFWDGLVSTALVVGVCVCILYVILSLLMPELAPEEKQASQVPKDRWLFAAAVLYFIAIGLELGKESLGSIAGFGKLVVVGFGLAILTFLATDFVLSIQRRLRPRSRS